MEVSPPSPSHAQFTFVLCLTVVFKFLGVPGVAGTKSPLLLSHFALTNLV